MSRLSDELPDAIALIRAWQSDIEPGRVGPRRFPEVAQSCVEDRGDPVKVIEAMTMLATLVLRSIERTTGQSPDEILDMVYRGLLRQANGDEQ